MFLSIQSNFVFWVFRNEILLDLADIWIGKITGTYGKINKRWKLIN